MSLALGRAKASKCRRAAVIVVDAPGGSRKGLGKGCPQRQGEGKGLLARGGDRNVHFGEAEMGKRGDRVSKSGKPGFCGLTHLHLDYSVEQIVYLLLLIWQSWVPALLQPWLNHHCGLLPTLGMPLKQLRGLPSSLSETKPRSVLPTATVPLGTYMGLCHPPPQHCCCQLYYSVIQGHLGW